MMGDLMRRIASGEQERIDREIEKLHVERRRWNRDPGYEIREPGPRRARARWLEREDAERMAGRPAGKDLGR